MANESEEAASVQGKTPISYLQELCNKRGVTPQYDLIANEGAVHEPLFVFKVTAGDLIGTGKGTSKKKAKHNAAISVLSQMGSTPSAVPGQTTTTEGSVADQFSLESKDLDARNPVGELQEMTQKRSWPPPVYEFTSEIGPAHAREFVCNVRLFNVCEQAVGKSKKLAKRNAALVMLEAIQQGGVEPSLPIVEAEEYNDDETLPIYDSAGGVSFQRPASMNSSARTQYAGENDADRVRKKISPMFQTLSKKTKLGPLLDGLQNVSLEDLEEGDIVKRLEDLGREQKFTVTYMDMSNISVSGKHQCIIELSTNPVTSCCGSSKSSIDDARKEAAMFAVQHLKIMTTRTNI